jgi:hypothetical protein
MADVKHDDLQKKKKKKKSKKKKNERVDIYF